MDWTKATRQWSSIGGNLAAEIELMIVRGTLPVGEKLPAERELAQKLGVSRTTLREALLALELRGLVSRRPGRGTIVLKNAPHEAERTALLQDAQASFAQTIELRSLVEPGIAALAAERATDGAIDALERLVDEARHTVSATRLLELDIEFHVALAAMSSNELLVTLMRQVSEWAGASRRLGFASRERTTTSLKGHSAIIAALRARDSRSAEAAMAEHIAAIAALVNAQSAGAI